MKHIWFLGTMGVVSAALFCVYFASIRSADADPLDAALMQSPGLAAIHKELAAHAADNPPMPFAKRQDLFAERFTDRFRKHEPKMAVRARFEEANHLRNRIKLMCPARLEPWNMDRIALCAWREAKDCLGESYDIDLYETYIGASPRKIGELRAKSGTSTVADIHYLPHSEAVHLVGSPLPFAAPSAAFSHRPRRSASAAALPVFSAHP